MRTFKEKFAFYGTHPQELSSRIADKIMDATLGKAAYRRLSGIVKERPLEIGIDLVSGCPCRCKFCANSKAPRKAVPMEMGLFKKIITDFCSLNNTGGTINLGMQSDCSLDPYFMERLQFLKQFDDKLHVEVITPLAFFTKYSDDEIKLFGQVVKTLFVSVLGTNREDYIEMSGVDAFDAFYETLYRFKKIFVKTEAKTVTWLNFRTKDIAKLKTDFVFQQMIEDFRLGNIMDTFFAVDGKVHQEDVPAGVTVKEQNNIRKKDDCVVPAATLFILADGRALGCGCFDWSYRTVIGDLNKDSITTVWKNDAAVKFRYAFTHGIIPEICKGCSLYAPTKIAFGQGRLFHYRLTDGNYWAQIWRDKGYGTWIEYRSTSRH